MVYDIEKDMLLEITTNNMTWKASTIAALYKRKWDIKIFFKRLKQNLNVKTFIGTSENAVKSQIQLILGFHKTSAQYYTSNLQVLLQSLPLLN